MSDLMDMDWDELVTYTKARDAEIERLTADLDEYTLAVMTEREKVLKLQAVVEKIERKTRAGNAARAVEINAIARAALEGMMSDKMLPPEAPSYGDLLEEIERLKKKCDYKDEVIEQRNAMLTRLEQKNAKLQAVVDAVGQFSDGEISDADLTQIYYDALTEYNLKWIS